MNESWYYYFSAFFRWIQLFSFFFQVNRVNNLELLALHCAESTNVTLIRIRSIASKINCRSTFSRILSISSSYNRKQVPAKFLFVFVFFLNLKWSNRKSELTCKIALEKKPTTTNKSIISHMGKLDLKYNNNMQKKKKKVKKIIKKLINYHLCAHQVAFPFYWFIESRK